MSYLTRYSEAMDYVREEFSLPVSVSMYEAVVILYEAYKEIKEKQSLKGEETCQTMPLPSVIRKVTMTPFPTNNNLKSKPKKKPGRPKKKG